MALDALADQRADLDVGGIEFDAIRVERRADAGHPPLIALALHESGSGRVEVRVVPANLARDGDVPREQCAVVVDLAFHRAGDTPDATSDIVVRRFSHGRRPPPR